VAGRTAGSLLFGLKPNDPATLIGAMLLLGGVALVASLGPARRAARLDPMQALREE
jgi:ABC-type antimicrobial peptide transport system permease subunit